MKTPIISGAKYKYIKGFALPALIDSEEVSTLTLNNFLMENVTAASEIEAGSWNRMMIKAHGNVFLNKVTMRSNHFPGGIKFVGANVTASQVTIIDNVGRNYLALAENIDKDANPIYSATLTNVHISGGASFVRQTGTTGTWDNWNSMLIEYPTESIKFNNVTVNMEVQDIGCMKVAESK